MACRSFTWLRLGVRVGLGLGFRVRVRLGLVWRWMAWSTDERGVSPRDLACDRLGEERATWLRLRLGLGLGLGLGLVRLDGHMVTLSGQGLVRRVRARRGDHMVGRALQVDGLPHTYPYPYPYS